MNESEKGRRQAIGQRLITFRESKGLDQSDFLIAILAKIKEGVSQGNLSHWEQGKFEPSYEKLLLIKRVFPDLDIEYILTGKNEFSAPSDVNSSAPTTEAILREMIKVLEARNDKLEEQNLKLDEQNDKLVEQNSQLITTINEVIKKIK